MSVARRKAYYIERLLTLSQPVMRCRLRNALRFRNDTAGQVGPHTEGMAQYGTSCGRNLYILRVVSRIETYMSEPGPYKMCE